MSDTLDYESITNWVRAYLQQSEFLLVEALAQELATDLMSKFSVDGLVLTLHTPDALDNAADVGIRIRRGVATI